MTATIQPPPQRPETDFVLSIAIRCCSSPAPLLRDQVEEEVDGLSASSSTCGCVSDRRHDHQAILTMMNHSTTEVFFDNLRVPAANLVGEEGKGFRYILSGMQMLSGS